MEWIFVLIVSIFVIIGMFLIGLGIWIDRRAYGKHSVEVEAECIHVEHEDYRTGVGVSDSTYLHDAKLPVYRYWYNGQYYTSTPMLRSNRRGYNPQLGKCRIRINPDHPEKVYSSERKFASRILIGIGSGYLIMIAIVAVILFAVGCGKQQESKPDTGDNNSKIESSVDQKMGEKSESDYKEAAKKLVSEMTLEEKIAQLFVITPEQITGVDVTVSAGETTRDAINKYPVGGMIYMGKNLENPEQTKDMIEKTQEYAKERTGLPMLISVDEEGGTVSRIASNPAFGIDNVGPMRDIGDSGDYYQAYQAGYTISSYLKDLGFNMDFAPDADVITNPENTVIGDRSFGTDPELVSKMVQSETEGMMENKVVPVLKHFPGHGGTSEDSHIDYAFTNKTMEELKAAELVPFAENIQAGANVIMAAHISCPEILGDNTPASLSSVMITDLLRGELGFDGVVITDALNMGAIANNYSSDQAAVKAISAGVDLLLMPADFQTAYDGLVTAVKEGEISEERIDESVERIVELKLEIE